MHLVVAYEAKKLFFAMQRPVEAVSMELVESDEAKEGVPAVHVISCVSCRPERELLNLQVVCLVSTEILLSALVLTDDDFKKGKYRLKYNTPASLADIVDNAQFRILAYYKLFNNIYGPQTGQRRERRQLPLCCVAQVRKKWPGRSNAQENEILGNNSHVPADTDAID